MRYVRCEITVAPGRADAVTGLVTDYAEGFETEGGGLDALLDTVRVWDYLDESLAAEGTEADRVIFYLEGSLSDNQGVMGEIRQKLGLGGMGSILFTQVDDGEWLDKWKETYKPFPIAPGLVIRPYWEAYQGEGETVVTLDPGSLFGTGLHETTRLCAGFIQRLIKPGWAVMDIGCGSGILGIIAAVLGASAVTAVDIEPTAAETVGRNARLNGVTSIEFVECDLLGGGTKQFPAGLWDAVLINIAADTVMELCPFMRRVLKNGGLVIASGIINGRLGEVCAAFEGAGFTVTETKTLGEWHAVAALL